MAETRFQSGSEDTEQLGDEGLLARPAETPQEEPKAEERPSWLPENFKTPEDFRRSYDEGQRLIQQQGAERNQYAQRLAEIEAQQQQGEEPTYDDDWQQAAQEETGYPIPITTLQALAAAAGMQGEQRAEQRFQQLMQAQQAPPQLVPQQDMEARVIAQEAQRAIPELEQPSIDGRSYGERVEELTKADSTLFPREAWDPAFGGTVQRTITSIRNAYRLVREEELRQQYEEAGISDADIARSRKLQARTTTPGAGGRPDQPDLADQKLAAMQQALGGTKV